MNKIIGYSLSKDKQGLIAHLDSGDSYHIHSDELSPFEIAIRDFYVDILPCLECYRNQSI